MTQEMTPRLRLDHLLCFTSAPAIETQLERCRAAGFLPHAQTARWDPGLHNGFVRLWPEYLEFLWVEDEAAFAASEALYHSLGGAAMREVREAGRPHGIGFYAGDVPALHARWRERGLALPEVAYWRLKTTPQEAPPDFAYQEVPGTLLPGAACFALTSYYPNAPMRREAWVAPNSVYALAGLTFVAADPEGRARAWRELLAPESALDGAAFALPPHRLRWLGPAAFEEEVGTVTADEDAAVGQERQRAGALDGLRQAALVLRRDARAAPRQDLAGVGDEATQDSGVVVIGDLELAAGEGADLGLAWSSAPALVGFGSGCLVLGHGLIDLAFAEQSERV